MDSDCVVDIDESIPIDQLKPNVRVALHAHSQKIIKVMPTKVDPIVSLMKVEKVPDSTYDMCGGLDKQIAEVKEVIELPFKHPELFEALGVQQPKGVLTTVLRERERPCLPVRSPITQIAPSSV